MRTFKLVLLSSPFLTLFVCFAFGQDPGTQAAQMAAQQSMQAAQQASDQAMRDMQQASQNAQAMQNAQQASDTTWQCAGCFARMPAFSVKPGTYSAPVTVKIKDRTRGATIYYTTDGWTPTESSTRYRGPITIASTTALQAIAISRQGGRSRVATALYTLRGTAPLTQPAQPPSATFPGAMPITAINEHPTSVDGRFLLAHGTAVPLIFASSVTSKTADVGDQINLTLAEDLKVGDVIVAKKGTPASGTVTAVDKNGMGGAPGEIFFEADSLLIDGSIVKLYGGAAKEGQDKVGKAIGLMFVPMTPVGIFVHGKNAEIKPGALFTAFVDADSLLPPLN